MAVNWHSNNKPWPLKRGTYKLNCIKCARPKNICAQHLFTLQLNCYNIHNFARYINSEIGNPKCDRAHPASNRSGGTPILERVDLLTAGISRVLCPNRVSGVEAVGTVPGEDPGYGNVPGGGPVTVGRTVPGEVVGDSPSIGP